MGMNERQSHWQDTNRLTVVVGHFGSGKTEFSVNLAFLLANKHRTALADLDIVDPYFCSREGLHTSVPATLPEVDIRPAFVIFPTGTADAVFRRVFH